MLSKLNTILIVGGTSGIGEAFVRRLHAQGKTIITTGRRNERLSALRAELPGLKTFQWDVTDIHNIGNHATTIMKTYPDIDCVFINSGIQRSFFLADRKAITDVEVAEEATTNFTAPMVILRNFVPDLIEKAKAGKATAILATTSGLAYVPVPLYPVYNGTKSGLHQVLVSLRQQVAFQPEEVKKNFNVVEVAPPYVETSLDDKHREWNIAVQGGPEKAVKPMKLEEYMNVTMEQLASLGPDGKMLKELGTGFSEMGIKAWRGAYQPIMDQIHMSD